jgi:myosin heavy subunit
MDFRMSEFIGSLLTFTTTHECSANWYRSVVFFLKENRKMGSEVIVETTIEGDGEGQLFRSVVADEVIDEFALTVADYDLNTPEGYEGNKSAIKWLTTMRGKVGELKKVLNEKALAHQRKVNKEESRLIDRLTAIETPLRKKKADFDNAAELKKKEMEAQREAMIKDRQEYFFSETGQRLAYEHAETWTQQQYESALQDGRESKKRAQEEKDRLAKEEADRKEKLRLAEEQIETERKELKRQQDELQAARDALAKQQREQEEREQAARDALAKQQREQEEREQAARDALAKQQREQEEREQAARDALAKQQEQAKPKPFHDAHMSFFPRKLTKTLLPQRQVAAHENELVEIRLGQLDDQAASRDKVKETISELLLEDEAERADRNEKLVLLRPYASKIQHCLKILGEQVRILEDLLDDEHEVLEEYLDGAGEIKIAVDDLQENMNDLLDELASCPDAK